MKLLKITIIQGNDGSLCTFGKTEKKCAKNIVKIFFILINNKQFILFYVIKFTIKI